MKTVKLEELRNGDIFRSKNDNVGWWIYIKQSNTDYCCPCLIKPTDPTLPAEYTPLYTESLTNVEYSVLCNIGELITKL